MTPTPVVGVGNPTMADDGLGRAVIDELESTTCDSIRTTFAGTTALLAMEALDGAVRGIVVDAVDAPGPPGTLHRFELADDEAPSQVTMHDFTFSEALRSCTGAYDLPDRVVVVGAVPETITPQLSVSDRITAVVRPLATLVTAEATGDRAQLQNQGMKETWYCVDCEQTIEADAIDAHEQQGHSVRGRLQPERLLSQRPSQRVADGAADTTTDQHRGDR